jgi:hypothetical protein
VASVQPAPVLRVRGTAQSSLALKSAGYAWLLFHSKLSQAIGRSLILLVMH